MKVRVLFLFGLPVAMACFGDGGTPVSGPPRCNAPADGSVSFGCVIVVGTVVGPHDEPLPEIEGVVRPTTTCGCNQQLIPVDSGGNFTVTIHQRVAGADTGTAVILMSASAPRYPRHVTGAPYFDTTSVLFRYARSGAVTVPVRVRLKILLPTS